MRSFFASLALASLVAPAAVAADRYELDPGHASATFAVSHLGVSTTEGRFNDIKGAVVLDGAKSTVSVEIATKSVDSNNAKRDQHLRSPDFFDAKQFPKLVFQSTKVTPTATGLKIDGKLTIKGRTKQVSLMAKKVGEGKDPWGGYRVGYDAAFTIKRSDFGVSFMPGGIGEEVRIRLALEGVKK